MRTPLPMMRRKRLRRTMALVAGIAASATAWATGPDLPFKIVRSGTSGISALQVSVIADPARVAAVAGESVLASKGRELARNQIIQRQLPSQPALAVAPQTITTPRFAVERMLPGVYAYTVNVQAKLRGGGAKPLAVSETSYFRVENGLVEIISAEEYDDAVQPATATKGPGGGTTLERTGSGNEAGITRAPGAGRRSAPTEDPAAAPAAARSTDPVTPRR
jgi:hypothetical protein